MEKLRVAVVGLGAISGHHIESVIALDTATLVAVCDIKEDKVAAAKEKYGSLLTIEDPGYVGAVLLTYEGEDKTVMDIVKEFDIELLDEYMERSIKNRKDNMEK